jgi:hypothetical protein
LPLFWNFTSLLYPFLNPITNFPTEIPQNFKTEKNAEILDCDSILVSSDRQYWIRRFNREEFINQDINSTPILATVIIKPPQNFKTEEKYMTYRNILNKLEDNTLRKKKKKQQQKQHKSQPNERNRHRHRHTKRENWTKYLWGWGMTQDTTNPGQERMS